MEQLFAFVLGVCIMSLIYGVVSVVRMRKEITILENQLETLQNDVRNIYDLVNKTDKRIDSRVDKLSDKVAELVSEIYRRIDDLERELGYAYVKGDENVERKLESLWRELDKLNYKTPARQVLND
jgi:conjugal transfer/entry exclusion protein